MRRLPKYVQGFIDRHGKPRFYFRRPGFTRLPLPGLPWMRRRILEGFRAEHGDKGIATLGRAHVQRMVSAKAATPGTALNFLVALRALMRHAVTVGLRVDDPTAGVRGPKFRSSGFYA